MDWLLARQRGIEQRLAEFEHRFEMPAGQQAQVDFAQFKVEFRDQPETVQVVWLFSMVLGYCRYLFGRYVLGQNLETVVSCHVAAFAQFGGVPPAVLYDRMKAALLGEHQGGQVRYHPTLLDLAAHYGFRPRACAPYRAKTKPRWSGHSATCARILPGQRLRQSRSSERRVRPLATRSGKSGPARHHAAGGGGSVHRGTATVAAAAGASIHHRAAHGAASVTRRDGERRRQPILGSGHGHPTRRGGPSPSRGAAPVRPRRAGRGAQSRNVGEVARARRRHLRQPTADHRPTVTPGWEFYSGRSGENFSGIDSC